MTRTTHRRLPRRLPRTRSQTPLLLALVSLAPLSACSNSSGSVDIGRNVGSELADYAANWDGYAEAYTFSDGSDRVRVTLDASGAGTVILGDSAAPAPLNPDDPALQAIDIVDKAQVLSVGLAYPVVGARVESKRIRLSINMQEPFRQWCEAQAPVCDSGGYCACLPNGSASCTPSGVCTLQPSSGGDAITVSSVKLDLCSANRVCQCTAAGCSIGDPTVQLDAALENGGTQLVGTFTLRDRVTVRMAKN